MEAVASVARGLRSFWYAYSTLGTPAGVLVAEEYMVGKIGAPV
jgi:hypothetical protein